MVKGEYVDMAHEILYDLFKNLVSWLEDEVEVGLKEAQKAQYKNKWIEACNGSESFSLEGRGDNWRRLATVFKQYGTLTQKANITVRRHYNTYGKELFTTAQEGRNKYIRLKVDKK